MANPPNEATYHRRKADLHEIIAQSIEGKQRWTLEKKQEDCYGNTLHYKTDAPLHQFGGGEKVTPIWMIAVYSPISKESVRNMWRGYLFMDMNAVPKYPRFEIETKSPLSIGESELERMHLEGFVPACVLEFEERSQRARMGVRW
ncbi:TPA: hypothetical protein HA251_05085 [Candidatus Woesearchaeota archaeon]|nr:hypothetical protein [Candidatus Woesearchaeota archaeon]